MTQPQLPANAPLIVIDLQVGLFDGVFEGPVQDGEGLLERARQAIAWARREGRGVAFIQHEGPDDDPLAPGEPGWRIMPELGQVHGEPTFAKYVGDAFSNPALPAWVAGRKASEVVLLGAQTDFCVAATVRGALAQGLAVTVVSDAHSTWDADGETADEIIARHNAEFEAIGARLVTTRDLTGG